MDYAAWVRAVEAFLKSRRPDLLLSDIDVRMLEASWKTGMSPLHFIAQLPLNPAFSTATGAQRERSYWPSISPVVAVLLALALIPLCCCGGCFGLAAIGRNAEDKRPGVRRTEIIGLKGGETLEQIKADLGPPVGEKSDNGLWKVVYDIKEHSNVVAILAFRRNVLDSVVLQDRNSTRLHYVHSPSRGFDHYVPAWNEQVGY